MESTKPSAGDNQPEPGSRSTGAASGAGNEVVSAAPVQRMSPAVQPPASAPLNGPRKAEAPPEPVPTARRGARRKWFILAALIFVLALSAYFFTPDIITALNTVSTDDAYVNGYVTFVAARVPGQVVSVLVDDDFRVKKGDLLVELDKTPYEVQVEIKKAALVTSQANLDAANAQARAEVGAARAARFALQHAIESVDTQVADLRAAVATYNSSQAAMELAKANFNRAEAVGPNGGVSEQELDVRREEVKVDAAAVDQALQQVYAIRAGLGLPTQPAQGKALDDVPPDVDQDFSTVRQDLGALEQATSQLGYRFADWNGTPKDVLEQFLKQDPHGDINHILDNLLANAPVIKQAQGNVLQAQSDLDQANLNLSYCDVVSEIDGVVTGRNVNPGDNVQTAQNLMAVRSLTQIWIDANFKETQLGDLRIGQRARCDVDMYGSRKSFEGRIVGFTMGTGETLSLLPPENATGNYVKIVQRLPVRIELTDYDPDKSPLFVGLSVTPYVYYKEPPSGPHAGDVLQPLANLPTAPTEPKP